MGLFDRILGGDQYKIETLATGIYNELIAWDNMRSTVGIRNMRGMDKLGASLRTRFNELWSIFSNDMGRYVSATIVFNSRRVPLTNLLMLIVECAQEFEKVCKTTVLSYSWNNFYSNVINTMSGVKDEYNEDEDEDYEDDDDEDDDYETVECSSCGYVNRNYPNYCLRCDVYIGYKKAK